MKEIIQQRFSTVALCG